MGTGECRRVVAAVVRDVFGPGQHLRGIVEEERESPDPGPPRELRELAGESAAIVAARIAHVESRAQRIDEAHLGAARDACGGAQIDQGVAGVWLAPAIAVERVVLR